MSDVKARACPACELVVAREAFIIGAYRWLRCMGCRSLFLAELPSEPEVAAFYTRAGSGIGDRPDTLTRMEREAAQRATRLAALGVRRIREVGCARGLFLTACRDRGLLAEGVEPGPDGDFAVRAGFVVHRAMIDRCPAPLEPLDAVAAWEVIEHLLDPAEGLRTIAGWLRKGGLLAISTPSASGIPARLMGRRFPMLCAPEHVAVFTRAGLERLLGRTGFTPIELRSFSALDAETLERGISRYLMGGRGRGTAVLGALSRAATWPAKAMDRWGVGTSYEIIARHDGVASSSNPAGRTS